mmetsp:Transcript_4560/g.13131  ORF Transcript_4560/g.13131 Transcript_4560/m.13131 type:complete len:207 (-) Transcript_4560:1063-1683(-)
MNDAIMSFVWSSEFAIQSSVWYATLSSSDSTDVLVNVGGPARSGSRISNSSSISVFPSIGDGDGLVVGPRKEVPAESVGGIVDSWVVSEPPSVLSASTKNKTTRAMTTINIKTPKAMIGRRYRESAAKRDDLRSWSLSRLLVMGSAWMTAFPAACCSWYHSCRTSCLRAERTSSVEGTSSATNGLAEDSTPPTPVASEPVKAEASS